MKKFGADSAFSLLSVHECTVPMLFTKVSDQFERMLEFKESPLRGDPLH